MRGENAQSLYRIERKPGFAQIPNEALRDERLSWRARGLLAYMLSFPDDWQHRAVDIEQHGTEGREAVRKALRELEVVGYRTRAKRRDDHGQIRTYIVLRDFVTEAQEPVSRSTRLSVNQASLEDGHEHGHETPSGSEDQAPKRERARNPIFDALAAIYPSSTKSEQSLIGMVAAELARLDPVPEPEEIIRRARQALREWPGSTPRALSTHWTGLGERVRGGGKADPMAKFDDLDDDYAARKLRGRDGQ